MPGMEVFGAEERREVMDVLETGALFRYGHENIRKGMWKTREFEEEIIRFTGARFAHAVSSGSSAVTTLMAASGIGHGDEIVIPPFTFVAPVESVFLSGALPVFGEIDETLCLSVSGIERAITSKTKAVLLVHMCGAAGDLEGILNLCKKHNLVLLEDCGQAIGAFYKGKSVGLSGAGGSFSFDYFKMATCGEGGALITNDENMYLKMEQISDHGHTHAGNNRGMEDHRWMGFNYRLSELSAAVGLAQMRKLPGLLAENRKNKIFLKDQLGRFKNIAFRHLPDETGDSATFLNLFLPSKEVTMKVLDQIEKDGLAGFTYWYKNMYHFINQWDHIKNMSYPANLAIHHLGAPKGFKTTDLRVSEDIMSRMISIGIRCTWTETELSEYAGKICKSLGKIIS